MNQNDRQFITDTINKALKTEVPVMIKTALDASNKEMKQFIVEHVSNEINDLAMVTAQQFERLERKMDKGFQQVDEEFDKTWICFKELNTKVDSIDNRLIIVEKKVDKFGTNYLRDTTHHELDKRVKKLEMVTV